MALFSSKFRYDYRMNFRKEFRVVPCLLRMLKDPFLRYIFYLRRLETVKGGFRAHIYRLFQQRLSKRTGNEIAYRQLGEGLILCHPYGITVNSRTVFGKNICLFKGCTIGSIRSGKREGVPTFGNNITVCANATVCGGITVGDNVLIAANAFVDFDVPSDSIVIGNPAKVIRKTGHNPCADYIDGLE